MAVFYYLISIEERMLSKYTKNLGCLWSRCVVRRTAYIYNQLKEKFLKKYNLKYIGP